FPRALRGAAVHPPGSTLLGGNLPGEGPDMAVPSGRGFRCLFTQYDTPLCTPLLSSEYSCIGCHRPHLLDSVLRGAVLYFSDYSLRRWPGAVTEGRDKTTPLDFGGRVRHLVRCFSPRAVRSP